MAKYTVEVRTILGQYWLNKNPDKTVDDLDMLTPDQLCNAVWDSMFNFPFPMFQGMTSQELCVQILMHYFMREIGLETVALWKHQLQVRMTGIMPYYVKLAESEISKSEALQNRNIIENVNRKGDETTKRNLATEMHQVDTGSQSSTSSGDSTRNGQTLVSDTPQDGLQNVINGTYLSNASVEKDDQIVSNKADVSTDRALTGNQEENEGNEKGYQENVSRETSGFDGDIVDTITRYREAILQIPLMIIKDLSSLFISILD